MITYDLTGILSLATGGGRGKLSSRPKGDGSKYTHVCMTISVHKLNKITQGMLSTGGDTMALCCWFPG